MAKVTLKKMKEYRNFILQNLKYSPLFTQINIRKLRDDFNGYGAQAMPKAVCDILNKIYHFAPEAAVEHDATWGMINSGLMKPTKEHFFASNKRLKDNIVKCATLRYSRFNLYRYWCFLKACYAEKACNSFGFKYWNKPQNHDKR